MEVSRALTKQEKISIRQLFIFIEAVKQWKDDKQVLPLANKISGNDDRMLFFWNKVEKTFLRCD